MGTSSSFTLTSFFFLLCLILSSLLPTSLSFQISLGGGRIAIGIGIGGGSSPSSPSSSTPKPSDFKSDYLYRSYFVIQQFKKTITCDPQGITNSWNGPDICNKYCGFYCEAPPGNDKNRFAVASVDFNGYTLRSNAFDVCAHSLSLSLSLSLSNIYT
jgi:hypothetical protein